MDNDRIFKSLMLDFSGEIETEEMKEVFKDLCNDTPRMLQDHLFLPVTSSNILKAKLHLLITCIEKGWIDKIFHSSIAFKMMPVIDNSMEPIKKQMISKLQEMTENMKTSTLSEEEKLFHLGVDEETLGMIRNNGCTIGEILLTKPVVLIRSDGKGKTKKPGHSPASSIKRNNFGKLLSNRFYSNFCYERLHKSF